MTSTRKPLFLGGCDERSIAEKGSRAVVVMCRNADEVHWPPALAKSSPVNLRGDVSEADQAILLDVLEAIYWDTVIPLASELRDAGVDLLRLELDRDTASYWESQPPYSPLDSQR